MKLKIAFILRLLVAIILLQTLYFKFGGHPEAVHIFTTLGVEPYGRILLGCIELIVAIGLLLPKTKVKASIVCIGLMMGALGFHVFTPLGIEVKWEGNSDHGQLFLMASLSLIFKALNLLLLKKSSKPKLSKKTK
jgi:putative oxidoreductase